MAKAIKSFAINTTSTSSAASSNVIYTCPINTTAKVLISVLFLEASAGTNANRNITLTVGQQTYICTAGANVTTTKTYGVISETGAGVAAATPEPLTFYLAAGQAISYSSTSSINTGSWTIKAQICVLEA